MSKQAKTTVILGGNGKTGRRVAERLIAKGNAVRLASRSTAIPFDWSEQNTWQRAVAGAGSLYVTYQPDLSVPEAAEQVAQVSALAVRAGVEQIVLLAGRGEPHIQGAQDAVRNCGVNFTILECAFFCQNFSEGITAPVEGKVVFPAGEVQEPFIDCDDIAEVAVEVLTTSKHDGQTYELTGPRGLTFAEATQAMAAASGQSVEYVQVSFERYEQLLQEYVTSSHAHFFVELFRSLLDGHNSPITHDVERVLGRPAKSFEQFAHETTLAS